MTTPAPLRSRVLRALVLLVPLCMCRCGGNGPRAPVSGLVTLLTHACPPASTGLAYATRLEAAAPHGPPVFQLVGGQLPPGLALDGDTGALAGWPRREGTYRFTVEVEDGPDPALARDVTVAADRRELSIEVRPGALVVLPFEVRPMPYRMPFSHRFEAAGGAAPYEFEVSDGALPAGLALRADGHLTGLPARGGAPGRATVRVRDAEGAEAERPFELRVVVPPLGVGAATLPDAARGFSYAATLPVAPKGGGAPYAFATGAGAPPLPAGLVRLPAGVAPLPAGLALDPSTGEVTGTPAAEGSFTFVVQVTDAAGQTAERAVTLRVNAGPALHAVTPGTRPAGGAPVTLHGQGFRAGMRVTFGVAAPVDAVVSGPTLATAAPPTIPVQSGPVRVRVTNPDGGWADLERGLRYPFATVEFVPQGVKGGARDSSRGIDAGDVDGDGLADIAHVGAQGIELIRPAGPTYANVWTTKVVRSDGAFNDVRLADVDRDGDLDLVAYRSSAVDTVEVYLNDGRGTFPPTASKVTPYAKPTSFHAPHSLDTGDVDGDGLPDVAFTSCRGNQGVLFVYRGLGDGSFAPLHQALDTIHDASAGCFGPTGVELADLDGDGRDDVLLADAFPSACAPGQACPATGAPNPHPGANELVAWTSLSGPGGVPAGWTVARLSGVDGRLDGSNACVLAYDHDGDGRLDAAVLGGYRDQRGCGIAFLAGDGRGGLAERFVARTAYNRRFGARIDANLDGCDDLVVVGGDGTLASGLGSGLSVAECWLGGLGAAPEKAWVSGAFDLPGGSIPGSNPGRVAVADFDGDGLEDFAVDQSFNAKERFPNDQGDGPVEGVAVYLNRSR